MAGVDIRTVQELMGHSTITMTMRYAHLSPAHLREAVNRASLRQSDARNQSRTVTGTVARDDQAITGEARESVEGLDELPERGGGAGRVRTAASQFCRLLP
jgi:integrase-like protein